ncbi:hypothetical protein BpHYR1_052957 [Brachionus plicatilis]|uniref:Uncharacterized protein n=1 Tax=Brachionus plicatilis TaxID=10195 RepID=A0A3M7Q4Z3_BRAPC|nr:hypothetical protein BpHYR1_052957 [Brachionus plicatilis]
MKIKIVRGAYCCMLIWDMFASRCSTDRIFELNGVCPSAGLWCSFSDDTDNGLLKLLLDLRRALDRLVDEVDLAHS